MLSQNPLQRYLIMKMKKQNNSRSISVKEFGAVGDGIHDDSSAIQKALSSRFCFIYIPAGTYLLESTLKVHSYTSIHCEPDTKLILAAHPSPDRSRFILTNEDHERGNCNIQIEGGIWDGNAVGNERGPDRPDSYTGVLINFFRVETLSLRSMQLSSPDSYHIRLCRVRNFQLHSIFFRNTVIRPNQDGIHIAGNCINGSITSISAIGARTPNDDLIALNADDNNSRAQNLGLENGPIRNIEISRLRAEDCHSFIRLLSTESPIEHIRISDVEGGFREHAVNMDAGRYCAVPVVPAGDPRNEAPLGLLQSVSLEDFRVHNTLRAGKAYVKLETACSDLSITRFNRIVEKEVDADSKTFEMNYLPACNLKYVGSGSFSALPTGCENSSGDRINCRLEENTFFQVDSGAIHSMLITEQ